MKKSFTTVINVLLSILFALALVEIGLRLLPGVIPLDLLIYFQDRPRAEIARRRELPTRTWDTILLKRDDDGPELRLFKPYTKVSWPVKENGTIVSVSMDEVGFCNSPQDSYEQPTIDIITLGDSFTFCHAVNPEETWTSQLSVLTGMSTYNLGRSGTGTQEYLQILKKFGLQKSPKIVIMNIYEGNDIRDAREYYLHTVENVETESGTVQSAGLARYLQSHRGDLIENLSGRYSYAFNLLSSIATYSYENYFAARDPAAIGVNFRYQLIFADGAGFDLNPENIDKDEVRTAKLLARMGIEPGVYEVIDQTLMTFVELSKQYDFIPIVVYTPSAHTAYAENVVFEDPDLTGLMKSFSYEQRQYLRLRAEQFEYSFVDLTPSLQEAARTNDSQSLLYYRHDLHLSPEGHIAVAKALCDALDELGIIEKRC